MNGSLWTLPVELRLYIAVLIAGMTGLLTRPIVFLAALAAILVLVAWLPGGFALPHIDIFMLENKGNWDGAKEQITGDSEAAMLLTREYRDHWARPIV